MIERDILIGLIVSTEFLKEIKDEWNPEYMESNTAKKLSQWCWEYYNKHNKAPYLNIEKVFTRKSKKLDKDLAEDIEVNILQGLSEEFESREDFDIEYTLTETREYFGKRSAAILAENIEALLEKEDISNAQKLIREYKPPTPEQQEWIAVDSRDVVKIYKEGFKASNQPVIQYKGAWGEFINSELIKGSFVSFLAPEKRGKTWQLMDMGIEAIKQGKKVAFFQAGDMTAEQQVMRIGVNVTRKPNKEKFIGARYVAVKDCVKNQIGDCNEKNKVLSPPLFPGMTVQQMKMDRPSFETLMELYKDISEYERCIDCSAYQRNAWGTVWLKRKKYPKLLTDDEAFEKTLKVLGRERNFRLDTYANGQLTVTKMENRLDQWKLEGWEPELILVDYMDLIVAEIQAEYRHQQNEIWKRMRGVSQKTNSCLVAPTQADAKAYKMGLLTLDNFSEDKRKYAHATAFIGMNQDPEGIEKELGIMRYNKLLARDDEFNHRKVVHVLQDLRIGRPIIDSYF